MNGRDVENELWRLNTKIDDLQAQVWNLAHELADLKKQTDAVPRESQ